MIYFQGLWVHLFARLVSKTTKYPVLRGRRCAGDHSPLGHACGVTWASVCPARACTARLGLPSTWSKALNPPAGGKSLVLVVEFLSTGGQNSF